MRTIYIDSEYRCHTVNDGAIAPVETAFFDGKCTAFVEGYRFVPTGETWTREDGEKFPGEMITPWKPYSELAAAQAQYENDQHELLADYQTELMESYQEGVNSV